MWVCVGFFVVKNPHWLTWTILAGDWCGQVLLCVKKIWQISRLAAAPCCSGGLGTHDVKAVQLASWWISLLSVSVTPQCRKGTFWSMVALHMGGAVICIVAPRWTKEAVYFSCWRSFLLTQCSAPIKMRCRFLLGESCHTMHLIIYLDSDVSRTYISKTSI